MTVSMRVMSAGDGYKYLLRTVAAADGDRALSTPLTRYYVEAGTPPGQWLGAGVASFGQGQLAVEGGEQRVEVRRQAQDALAVDFAAQPVRDRGPGFGRPFRRVDHRVAAADRCRGETFGRHGEQGLGIVFSVGTAVGDAGAQGQRDVLAAHGDLPGGE